MKATFVLEDGTVFEGIAIGSEEERVGPVVLHTGVVGYQEMMTDPANTGKILVLTYPLIGNYGIARTFTESPKARVAAIAIGEESHISSNWQSEGTFDAFLRAEGIAALSGIDTRMVAVTLRDKGEMHGIITTGTAKKEHLLSRIREWIAAPKESAIKRISTAKIARAATGKTASIGVIDIGITRSVIAQLATLGAAVTMLPYDTPAEKILALRFSGVLIPNGPEDDPVLPVVVRTVKALIGKVALMGISTGHQVIGLALGGRLSRLALGHRGANYPVLAAGSFKGMITCQNHGLVIDEDSIRGKREIAVTLRNANDRTIEEIESRTLKIIGTQYYPVSPGFDEVNNAFVRFLAMARTSSGAKTRTPTYANEVQYAKA